ncbi:pilus assembly protein [Streptacidiphilus sp. PB12-B1b]|uniref:TadE/TadG family type IV pilus assembly protein n=1 Tax=Streptacidiphilus sp. PB12-B1b TaxID=2705012 RepID=UPI0015F7D796|nr:TadE/TadG family type IV pilus assembly protein [Streptacidiphilus sp. PB12-B1b]QMU76163.1 pilus assembly protein [Streptacidiphilus sp. PB12-B1b]
MTRLRPPRLPAALERLRGDDGGTTSISFAMVFPVILLLVLLVVQGGLLWWARDVALAAAREGSSVARSYRSAPDAGAAQADLVLRQYGGGLTVRPSTEGVPKAGEVEVTVHVQAQSVLPFVAGTWITTGVTSPKEAWLP